MKNKTQHIVLKIILCFSCAHVCAAEIKEKQLYKNPFIKPINVDVNVVAINDNGDLRIDNTELVLRATLTSDNDNSIANINGEMLVVGQKINEYELVEISIGSALLRRNGTDKVLMVNEKYRNIK